MSVFAQYVPYKFAHGTWDERREEVRQLALNSLARFCSNIESAIIDAQVLGPPDIERKVGLTGGHIFQGECLPPYMWSKRLSSADAHAWRLLMRGVHASGRQRDRHQWTQCRNGCSQRCCLEAVAQLLRVDSSFETGLNFRVAASSWFFEGAEGLGFSGSQKHRPFQIKGRTLQKNRASHSVLPCCGGTIPS